MLITDQFNIAEEIAKQIMQKYFVTKSKTTPTTKQNSKHKKP